MNSADDRALGALYGLAIGDALGMPTQLLSRDQVAAHFGTIEGFRELPPDHGIAAVLAAGVDHHIGGGDYNTRDQGR